MRFSKITLDVLKNLATINQGLVFKPGNMLKTMNVMKNQFALVEIPDVLPIEFAIYDLNELLATHSLMDSPEISFQEDCLILEEGIFQYHYFYSNPSVVISPGDKKIIMPPADIKFTLDKGTFDQIIRSSSVMKLKDILVTSTGVRLYNRNNVGNRVEITPPDFQFNGKDSLLKVENLKLIPVSYVVEIDSGGIAHFVSKSEEYKIEYFIALETNDEEG